MNEPTLLDLFSGIGGFSLAFESEGFRTIGFAEIDHYASAVLRKHWPDVPNYGDVRNVGAVRCDVIAGGFPCQPFSLAGKRGGAADDRHLWPAMLAVIERCRPAYVLGENVPGIIGMELDRVLSDLEGIGYAARTLVVPACAVDARHRRDRVWIIADATGQRVNGIGSNHAGAGSQRDQSKQESYTGSPRAMANGSSTGPGDLCQVQTRRELAGWGTASGCCRWDAEPDVGRVANGVSNRSHRLRCLGNSIVPQVAQVIARAIYQQLRPT